MIWITESVLAEKKITHMFKTEQSQGIKLVHSYLSLNNVSSLILSIILLIIISLNPTFFTPSYPDPKKEA